MTPEEYLVIEAKIRREQDNVERLEKELASYGLYPDVTATTVRGFPLDDAAVVRIVGSILHDYYTALEKIFETIASQVDRSVPQGDAWHKELLDQMTLDIPGLRPALISIETAHKLDPFRGFGHVFRNVYGFGLSSAKVLELLCDLPPVASAVREDLGSFTSRLRALLDIGP